MISSVCFLKMDVLVRKHLMHGMDSLIIAIGALSLLCVRWLQLVRHIILIPDRVSEIQSSLLKIRESLLTITIGRR